MTANLAKKSRKKKVRQLRNIQYTDPGIRNHSEDIFSRAQTRVTESCGRDFLPSSEDMPAWSVTGVMVLCIHDAPSQIRISLLVMYLVMG